MSERKAVTKKLALEYGRGDKARKGQILDQVCELNGWHRSHARTALKQALVLKVLKPRPPRPRSRCCFHRLNPPCIPRPSSGPW